MVARRGNAPRSAGCGPAALLLSYRAKIKSGGWLTTCTPTRVAGSHRFRDEPGALARLVIRVLPTERFARKRNFPTRSANRVRQEPQLAPASTRLEGGCLRLLGHGSVGKKWWVVSVMLRRWSGWTSALQAARDLYAATNPENVWAPAAFGRSAPGLLFMKMVDRHGFAPCSSACGADDLLNDRAAQEKDWSRGWESNPRVNGL